MTARAPYGTTFATFRAGQQPDLDPSFRPISGEQAAVQGVLQSWFTPPNTATRGGRDIRSYAQMRTSATNRAMCRAQLKAQAERDERVRSAEVVVEPTAAGIRITGRITLRTGSTFRIVTSATEAAANIETIERVT